jgi:hypothetical protein
VGPRIARLHVGAGGTGISTGAGAFTAYKSLGGNKKRRRNTTADRSRAVPAPRVATETEKVRARQTIKHAIERADQDAFDLAIARYVDLASTKVGANDLGTITGVKAITDDESRELHGYLDIIRGCVGHADKVPDAEAAASKYNTLVDNVNRRVDMMVSLGASGISHEDRMPHIEIDGTP